jgi:hypothetical protein
MLCSALRCSALLVQAPVVQLLMVRALPKTDMAICPTATVQLLMVRTPPKTKLPDYDGAGPAEDRFARLQWCNC